MALNGEDTHPRRAAFHGNAAPRASLATGKGEEPRQKQRVDQWITTFPVDLDLINSDGDISLSNFLNVSMKRDCSGDGIPENPIFSSTLEKSSFPVENLDFRYASKDMRLSVHSNSVSSPDCVRF